MKALINLDYKEKTCYIIADGGYADINYCLDNNIAIISAEQFLKDNLKKLKL